MSEPPHPGRRIDSITWSPIQRDPISSFRAAGGIDTLSSWSRVFCVHELVKGSVEWTPPHEPWFTILVSIHEHLVEKEYRRQHWLRAVTNLRTPRIRSGWCGTGAYNKSAPLLEFLYHWVVPEWGATGFW